MKKRNPLTIPTGITMDSGTTSAIELTGMEFKAYHGCLEEERRNGNVFTVDFLGEADLSAAAQSDDLADTADYSVIYNIISAEMAKPSNLLENVAGRIIGVLRYRFPQFSSIRITVAKKNPPVGGNCAWSKVSLQYRKSDE